MENFIENVTKMRDLQKKYFRYRTPDDLREAKKLEKLVDADIERLTGTPEKKQKPDDHPSLFNGI